MKPTINNYYNKIDIYFLGKLCHVGNGYMYLQVRQFPQVIFLWNIQNNNFVYAQKGNIRLLEFYYRRDAEMRDIKIK